MGDVSEKKFWEGKRTRKSEYIKVFVNKCGKLYSVSNDEQSVSRSGRTAES